MGIVGGAGFTYFDFTGLFVAAFFGTFTAGAAVVRIEYIFGGDSLCFITRDRTLL